MARLLNTASFCVFTEVTHICLWWDTAAKVVWHFHSKALKYRHWRTPPTLYNTMSDASKNQGNGEQGSRYWPL